MVSVDTEGKETKLCDGLPYARDATGRDLRAHSKRALLVNSSILGKRV